MLPDALAFPLTAASLATALGLLAWRRNSVRGTTLAGPWWWSVIALALLAAVETIVALNRNYADASISEPLRLVALTGLFTPFMSQLGAKRPQDRAWHFIVLSLWAILALPAAETLFLQRGQALEVYDARCWFLLALVAVSAANLGLTRWWPSALLIAAAQMLTLAEYLPWLRDSAVADWPSAERIAIGSLLLAIAAGLPCLRIPRRRNVPAWDAHWRDFRDSFGALWAIRVAEQVNQSAEQHDWPFRLRWNGFRLLSNDRPLAESPFETQPILAQVMENLFRRFVDEDWTRARLGKPFAEWKRRGAGW